MAKTTIHSDYIPDNAITSTKIAENSIGAREIATNAITTLYVADGSVTTVKIADDAITSAKLDTNIDIAGTFDVTGATTLDAGLTVDTDTLVVDATNNRVGIGATSPSKPLHLKNTSPVFRLEDNDGGYAEISASSGNVIIRADEGASQASSNIRFEIDDDEKMRIDSSGKVIIGDNSSHVDDLLQIETPASGGGHGIQIRRNDSNNDQGVGHIQFGNNTDTDLAKISAKTDGATDSGALQFSTQATGGSVTERMRIDSSGNVGIDTINPTAKLHVEDTSGDDLGFYVFKNSRTSAKNYSSSDMSASSISWIQAQENNTSLANTLVMRQFDAAIAISALYNSTNTGSLAFGTNNGSQSVVERMRISSTGNVGIGTESPAAKLSVVGTSLTNTSTTGIPAIRAQGGYGGGIGLLDTKEAGWYAQDSGDTLYQYVGRTVGSDTPSSKVVMTYKSTGNVGIGETTPDDTLHVNNSGGTARIRIGSGNDAYYTRRGYLGDEWVFGTGETGDNVDFKISGGAFTAANAGGNFRFFTQMSNGTPAERMLISSEGYLEVNSFSAQPDDTDTSTHRKIEFKANGGGSQTHKRDCFVQSNVGNNQYHWYKIVLGSNVYGRGSNIKYTANWSTGHASGQGIVDGSFICRAQHNDSRISVHGHVVYSRQVVTGTYYGWDYDPDIELYTSTATGSSAGLYMRVQGSRTSGYDGGAIHALYLEIFGSRNDTAYQGIYQVGTSTPSDAGSAISRTILS